MSFNDDEQIANPGPRPKPNLAGRVKLVPKKPSEKAPLEKNNFTVMLELIGGDFTGDRPGTDLVAVLDVSGSMKGDKIKYMKTAMQFVIKKLSPIDRLSIVTFSETGTRLCPLRQITEASQSELQGLIDGLKAGGGTNISNGLLTGLKVLDERKLTGDRDVGVMLMSDGRDDPSGRGDATQVVIGKKPVFTFGLGDDHDPRVLDAVAKNSMGGTYNPVNDIKLFNQCYSQIFAGLVSIVVQDLVLTVETVVDEEDKSNEVESTILNVTAGCYPADRDPKSGFFTVKFGFLFSKEVRTAMVELDLPTTTTPHQAEILKATASYKFRGQSLEDNPTIVKVQRTGTASSEDDKPEAQEVEWEKARLRTVTLIKAARTMADNKNLGDARTKLVEAQKALWYGEEQSSPLLGMLRTELKQLKNLMDSQALYEKEGRPYALSAETSHDRQRFAARGDSENMRLFATPRMNNYLEQAKRFDEDPTAPLPSVDEDVKEELAANPLSPFSGPITFYVQAAIQALQAIEMLIKNGGTP